jgi:predicted lactoylglutathione lyase
MEQRLNMVMVAARDIVGLRSFYEAGLGWATWGPVSPHSVLYKLGTAILVFLDEHYLARESGLPVAGAPKSIWAIFVDSKETVDRDFARAVAAGATVTSAVRDRDQGLYSGYFADPEGNGWEVVWSPHLPIGDDGGLTLPGA